jgi:hypothetical protein
MRPRWLIACIGVASIFLAEFGPPITAPVIAADPAGSDTMPICPMPTCLSPQVTTKSGIGTANAMIEAKVSPEAAEKWCAIHKPRYKYCVKDEVKMGGTGNRSLYRASADCVAGRMTPIDGNTYTYIGVWEDGPGKGRPKFTTTNRQFPHTKWDETGVAIHPSGEIIGWGGGSPNLATQWEVLCAGAPAPATAAASTPQPAAQAQPGVQMRPNELQQFSTETQLQTADFGTPEATAKIAAKAGFVDVVGVKLGMPLKAALDALRAHNANFVMEPVTIPPYEALPGVAMNPLLTSKKNTNTPSSQEKEYVGLLVTMAPSEPFVWGMWREVSYEKEESRPTIETVQDGLRKKYGQESVKDVSNRLFWMYDAQGQQVMKAKADEILTKCVSVWMVGLGQQAQLHAGYFNRQIVGGYFNSSYGKDPFNGLCQSYSLVQAEYTGRSVMVSASNRQLEVSGVTASHTLLMREATKLADKRKGDAEKREVPKF